MCMQRLAHLPSYIITESMFTEITDTKHTCPLYHSLKRPVVKEEYCIVEFQPVIVAFQYK